MSSLELTSLRKSYGPVAAVDGVSLQVATGSRTAIVGPSGSGKTTLLRLIAGFERPDAGRINLEGMAVADRGAMVPAYRREIGVVAQDGALFPHLSIAENIAFGLTGGASANAGRVGELLEMVGLEQTMLARKPDQLSGGQQQRVALARALARKPRLMLLDEPFSALDTGLRAATRKAVSQVLGDAGVTTVLVTHDQGEALAFADQVAVMRNGRLIQVGAPRELYLRPDDELTAAFLGEAIILDATIANGRAHCALGEVDVDDPAWLGPAKIMLRPEQLSVRQLGIVVPVEGAAATVGDIEFCGSTYDAAILLDAGGGTLRLRLSSADPVCRGDRVHIALTSAAHRLRG